MVGLAQFGQHKTNREAQSLMSFFLNDIGDRYVNAFAVTFPLFVKEEEVDQCLGIFEESVVAAMRV